MLNLLIFVMRLLARMPLPWLRAVGHGLGWSLWLLARKRRRVVTVNLQKCMPELSEPEREALAYRHFVVFGKSVLDRAWLWHAPEALVRQRLRWVGDLQALKQPGPLVMFAPHFVGLEAGGMAVSLDVPGPVAFIFVGQSNPAVEALVRQGRERSGNVRPYYRHEGMRQILVRIKKANPCTCPLIWILAAVSRFLCPSWGSSKPPLCLRCRVCPRWLVRAWYRWLRA